MQNTRQDIPANAARQGRLGYRIFLVLVVGLMLAMAIWLGLEFYGEMIDTGSTDAPGSSDAAPITTVN